MKPKIVTVRIMQRCGGSPREPQVWYKYGAPFPTLLSDLVQEGYHIEWGHSCNPIRLDRLPDRDWPSDEVVRRPPNVYTKPQTVADILAGSPAVEDPQDDRHALAAKLRP